MAWDWFGRGRGGWAGPWPGRGPFSYLPPWQRPGWLFGRGWCWQFLAPSLRYARTLQPYPPYYPVTPYGYPPAPYGTATPAEELASLEDYKRTLSEEIKGIEARIEELKKLIEQKTST